MKIRNTQQLKRWIKIKTLGIIDPNKELQDKGLSFQEIIIEAQEFEFDERAQVELQLLEELLTSISRQP